MQRAFRFMVVTLLFLSMGISGCVSTTLQTDWKDPAFRGTFKKVIVICLVKELVIRNTLEDNLTAQFKSRGVEAVQSYTLFPSLENIDKEAVRAKVGEIHADGVFLVRRIDKGSVTVETAQFGIYNLNYYEQWGIVSQRAFEAPQSNTVDVYKVETSLYEATKGMLVWQALSETYDDDSLLKIINNFALLMAKKLSEQGLI
jgi:hypothetical protein